MFKTDNKNINFRVAELATDKVIDSKLLKIILFQLQVILRCFFCQLQTKFQLIN